MRRDWTYKPLGDVCDVVGGGTPSKRNPAFYEGSILWATVRDMRDEVLSSTEFRISEDAVKSSSTKVIPSGNVVMATRVGLGKACLLAQDTAINQDLRAVIPKSDQIDTRFLLRWFQSISEKIVSEGTGATVKGVKLPFIKSLQLPMPSLGEQKRIVAILDEAFAGIETAIANTEKNLVNSRELFKVRLNKVFSDKGLQSKEGLSKLIEIKHGFAFKSAQFHASDDESQPIVLTPGNYGDDGELHFGRKNTKRLKDSPPEDFRFAAGDLTIVMTDLSPKMNILGKPAFVPTDNVLHNQRIGRVLFKSDDLSPRYLYYFLMTDQASAEIKRTATGTMVRHTAPKRILGLDVPLPIDRSRQDFLVEYLDRAKQETSSLESSYQKKLAALIELKQSLLQKAFSGELTAKQVEDAAEGAAA